MDKNESMMEIIEVGKEKVLKLNLDVLGKED